MWSPYVALCPLYLLRCAVLTPLLSLLACCHGKNELVKPSQRRCKLGG